MWGKSLSMFKIICNNVALKCHKVAKILLAMLQWGRKLSQHATRIYCHNVALKCHKLAKLYILQYGRKLLQLAVRIYYMWHLWQKCGISVLFSDCLIFCRKWKIKLQFCHLYFVTIWFQFLQSGRLIFNYIIRPKVLSVIHTCLLEEKRVLRKWQHYQWILKHLLHTPHWMPHSRGLNPSNTNQATSTIIKSILNTKLTSFEQK